MDENNDFTCTLCDANNNWAVSNSGICEFSGDKEACNGFFEEYEGVTYCISCPNECSACNSDEGCTSCIEGFTKETYTDPVEDLTYSYCISGCASNLYLSPNNECERCDISCEGCIMDASFCTSCARGYDWSIDNPMGCSKKNITEFICP